MKPLLTTRTRFLSVKTAACALALTGAVLLPTQSAYAQNIGVQLNGNSVNFSEAAPVNISGSVLVPMRGVFEAMNASVRYQAATRTIIAGRGNREIQLSIGSATAYVNGSPITLSQPARIINGSTFVPLRFVADALGASVRWESATSTVIINDEAQQGGGDMGGTTPPPMTGTSNVPTTGIGNTPNPVTPIPNPPTTVPATGTTAAEGITAVFERVDTAPPASMVLLVGGQNKRYDMAANVDVYTQVGNGTTFGPLVPIDPTNLRPGEDVQVVLNEGMITRVTAKRVVRAGRVLSSTGNRIVLTDGTQLNIGPRLRFTNPQGENTTEAALAPNSTVALFVRQNTGAIYGVSATPADVAAANNLGVTATVPGNANIGTSTITNPGAATMGAITMVKHSAAAPLTINGVINVEVRGTPGLRGTFSLSQRLSDLPLTEGPAGLYRGTYTVRTGDDVLNSFVTARLVGTANGANVDETQQSEAPLTIDTVAPRIVSIEPAANSTVGETRPTIIVTVDDVGGSGLAKARYELTDAAGKRPIAPMTVVPPNRATVVVNTLAAGRVSGRVGVSDAAGNELLAPFAFTVQPRAGAINSVTQDSTRPLRLNDVITVDVQAQPGGRATFDLVTPNNQVVANNVPMNEINGTGRYRGTYNFNVLPNADQVRVRARFDDLNGGIDTLDAQTPVMLSNVALTNQAFSITAPAQNSAAGNNVTVSGRGTPGALVDVTVTAQGVRTLFGIIGYQQFSQAVDTKQVQVDAQGNWTTPAITLTAPRGIAQLRYEISAVQTDVGNQKSQPQTVTLTAQ